MALLLDILYGVRLQSVRGGTDILIEGVTIDSRTVLAGSLFVALAGGKNDGNSFVADAVRNGAVAILTEADVTECVEGVTYLTVSDIREALGVIADNFFGNPSSYLKVVGVTGTNGKTTISTLLYKLFTGLGHICGLIGTVEIKIANEVIESTHTTPDCVSLHGILAKMVSAGCKYVFMECSSHAIHQGRLCGVRFVGGIFSNITHDHLDYHKTFDEYIRVKKSFFDKLGAQSFAISNSDDKRGAVMLQNTGAKKIFYSLQQPADHTAKILDNSFSGLHLLVDGTEVYCRLIGRFNAYNLLAVYAVAKALGVEDQTALIQLSKLTGAEGRFDYIMGYSSEVGIVDYAHTPDALLNVLETIQQLRRKEGRIITIVGCGGDRDRTKRSEMAKIACQLSDSVIFTSDNPRSEDASAIIKDMEMGVGAAAKRKYKVVVDRREAIAEAVSSANSSDIILIAGKGHEKYQEIKGVKYPFDDKETLCFFLDKKGKMGS